MQYLNQELFLVFAPHSLENRLPSVSSGLLRPLPQSPDILLVCSTSWVVSGKPSLVPYHSLGTESILLSSSLKALGCGLSVSLICIPTWIPVSFAILILSLKCPPCPDPLDGLPIIQLYVQVLTPDSFFDSPGTAEILPFGILPYLICPSTIPCGGIWC